MFYSIILQDQNYSSLSKKKVDQGKYPRSPGIQGVFLIYFFCISRNAKKKKESGGEK